MIFHEGIQIGSQIFVRREQPDIEVASGFHELENLPILIP
jgi:hypothetical protein